MNRGVGLCTYAQWKRVRDLSSRLRGISLGCPLSPVMGALYLDLLDRRMAAADLCYARFMDDWVILLPTRWALRRAISLVNRTLEELKVEQHPGKTVSARLSADLTSWGIEFRRRASLAWQRPPFNRFKNVCSGFMSKMRRRR